MDRLVKKCLYPQILAPGRDPLPAALRLLEREIPAAHVRALAELLPAVRIALEADLLAALKRDPAADSRVTVVRCYPGFHALCIHRIAHALYCLSDVSFARLLSECAHSRTGIDIHPGAKIGPGCFIDHGTGVVIGQSAILGKDVTVYQGVTLGALHPQSGGTQRHPVIGDGVTLYAGATVLGGQTQIGSESTIGAGAFVTRCLPPGSKIPARAQII